MTGQCYDFAVVGGGLVGATIARGLARQGLKVVVLDEGDVAYRASRGNFALVWVQSKGLNMPAYANWTRRSVLLWPSYAEALEAETGIDVSLEQEGGFHLALSEAEMERTVSLARRINAQPGVTPYTYSVLDGDEIRRRLPGAGPEIVGGTYSPMDGHLNALRLFRATHKAMLVAGVDYRPRQAVVSIGSNDGFRLFSSDAAEVRAARIVLAAGLDNRRLAPMVGLEAPVRPQRGNIIVTEKTAPFLRLPVQTVRQTDEGSVMIGDSQEEAGFSEDVNSGILGVMADRAVRMFPLIGELNVVRMWACLRVLSQDGFPIYDQSETHPGAFLTTCHSGVTLAAAHADLLASCLARGALPDETSSFSVRRFHVSKAA
jgi:hydrogen cyanide synthase HcnC